MTTETHELDLSPDITDEAFEEAKAMNGIELRTDERGLRRRHSWNQYATIDNFRHFARGYGDDNPLFTDPSYAADTRWGEVIAPPMWLYTVDTAIIAPKLAGVQWIYAGTEFEFERPVYAGEKFHVSVKQTDIERKEGATAGDMALQEGKVQYFNQEDNLVATATGQTMRIPRPNSDGSDEGDGGGNEGIQQYREPIHWSEEELQEIEEEVRQQSRRGNDMRYWDTVSAGDELEPRIKGPLSVTDMLCWYMGAGSPLYFAHELFVKERQRHPSEAFRRPDHGIYEHPAMGHVDPSIAVGIGVPRAYDIGPQRLSWLVHTVSDWMSDAGFVKSFSGRLHGLNFIGELTRCKGTVTDTYVDEETGEHLIDIDLTAVNQDGDSVASGDCTVELPTS